MNRYQIDDEVYSIMVEDINRLRHTSRRLERELNLYKKQSGRGQRQGGGHGRKIQGTSTALCTIPKRQPIHISACFKAFKEAKAHLKTAGYSIQGFMVAISNGSTAIWMR